MRILMLTQFYPPFIGGEERFVWTLGRELAAHGHDVAIATLWNEGLPRFEVDQGVRVYRVRSTVQRAKWLFSDPGHSHAPPLPDPELCRELHRVIAREQPQIVHAHNWIVHSFLPLKPWSKAKLVLTLHDYSLSCSTKKLIYRDRAPCSGPGLTKCLRCAADHYGVAKGIPVTLANWGMGVLERGIVDMFLPVSQATAAGNGLIGTDLPFQVIPNFLPDDISETRSGMEVYLAQLPSEGYLLFVGAFGSYKGIDVLLEAYAGLTQAPPLVLIGYETKEFPIATNAFPPNVLIVKNWPHAAVMEAWRGSIAGLVPSLSAETFGVAALEAMAMGRPVIASRIGALQELVVDAETGFLVPPGDSGALRDAVQRLLADRELRERLGKAGRARAELFKASLILPRLESIYRQLADGFASDDTGGQVSGPAS